MFLKQLIYDSINQSLFHFVQIIKMFTLREQTNILNILIKSKTDKSFIIKLAYQVM